MHQDYVAYYQKQLRLSIPIRIVYLYFLNNNKMITILQQILNQADDCSSLSADASFTLQDILLQPDELLQDIKPDIQDYEDMFDDDDEVEQNQQPVVISNKSEKNESEPIKKSSQKQESKSRSSKLIQIKNQEKINRVVRDRRLKDMKVPSLSQVNNMTYIVLKNVTALFQNPQKNGVGISTVITATGSKFLGVGTSMGNIALFEVGVKGYKLLGTSEHKKYGQITSISISKDNKYLVGGQEGGLLTVWDLNYYSQVKRELATKCKIIKLLFCTENQFILNDIQGNIYLYTIEKYLWVNLKSQRIFEKTDAYFYDIKAHTLHSNIQILALCTLDYVLILSYKPQVVPMFRLSRPQDLYFSKLPNIQLGRCAVFSVFDPENSEKKSSDVLCVSWSKSIFIYKFVDGKTQQQCLELINRFEQQTPIYNMQFISDGILVTLDNRQTFRTYRLWVNSGGGYMTINQREVPEEVIYQRFLRDKNNKYIKSYNNTIISCSFNPKDKELFFICKNSIYRCRIHRWNDAINQLINNDRQFLKALKLCLQLFNKRLNIFLEPVLITDKTVKLFCEIGRLFLVERLKQIEKLNENRVKNIDQKSSIKLVQQQLQQAYQCLIQYMIQIKSQNYLYERIFREVIKQRHFSDEYHHKFLDCLQPFILSGSLTRIPTVDLFREITGHFLKQGKKNLVDNLIISLEIESIFYAQAIQMCEQNKLYRALAYVCSTHGEYVPPLNKVLREIVDAQNNGHSQAQQIYYMILKDYIVKLLACIYINGNPFIESPEIMKKSLSTWLTCRQTFTFFAKNIEESYQKDYFYFLQGMIQSLNQQQSLKEYIHSILKDLIKERHKEKQIAELFIKISSTVQLGQEEIQLIVQHSTQSTIKNNLLEYFEFVKKYASILQKLQQIQLFFSKNKQVRYLFQLVQGNGKDGHLLEKTNILEQTRLQFNQTLVQFILSKLSKEQIVENIEDLLKIHSEVTMVYMLQKFQLDVVNERLMSIRNNEYRYMVVRKLLKKLRKQMPKQQKSLKNVSKSKIVSSRLVSSRLLNESQDIITSADLIQQQNRNLNRLGKQVMEFYITCLCKYKREKRVYYEFTAYMDDYRDNLPSIIKIIQPYGHSSVLGLLEETMQNYEAAYKYYSKVYRHYFFEENYKKLMRVVHCHGRFMRRIFQRMLSIAQRTNTVQRWLELLQSVVKPLQQKSMTNGGKMVCDDIQQVFKKKKKHPFLQQLAQILQLCLVNVSNQIPIQKISMFIVIHKSIFVKQFVLNSFRSTLVTYSKNAYFYLLANEMIINDQVTQFQQIYTQQVVGSPFERSCQHCGKEFEVQDQLSVFTCGHAYHKNHLVQSKKAQEKEQQSRNEEMQQKQLINEAQVSKQIRCQKCIILQTKGDQYRPTELPDFNIAEQGMLSKGMKGITNFLPSVMGAIALPISVFTKSTPIIQLQEQEEKVDEEQLKDMVYDYVAFEKTLHQKGEEFQIFLNDYQVHLQKRLYFQENGQ